MSGRGNLLSLFTNKTDASVFSSSSGEHAKDSGLDVDQSISSGDYFRLAREEIANEVSVTFKNVNVSFGRGRAQLLENFQTDEQQLGMEIPKDVPKAYFRNQLDFSQNSKDKDQIEKANLYYPDLVHGCKGSVINLACNYVELKSDPRKGVFLYEVRFFPTVDSIQLRVKYLNEHKEKIGGTKTFDGTTLYLPILLKEKMTRFVCKTANNSDIEIKILFKKKESLKNCSQLYNILFDRVMKTLNYVRFDRKQYDPSRPKIIPLGKLEVWPGYVIAVEEYEGGLMLCCDVSHRLLCQRTVLDMLIEIYQHNKNLYQEVAKKSLIGSIVITRYNNRTYRIDDISFDQNPLSTFDTRNGSISYLEYYQKHHYINIKDNKQPLLLSVKKTRGNDSLQTDDIRFCLIPELCYLTGLSDEIRADQKLMRDIVTFTRVSPNQRMLALNKFYENVSESEDARKILENWGLSLFKKYNNLIGRQMDQEKIYFASKSVSAGKNSNFSRDAMNNEMLQIVHLRSWIIIHFRNDLKVVKSLLDNMERCCKSFGMSMIKPKIFSLDQDRLDAYVDTLRKNIGMDTQIVVCICSNSRDDRYSAIKKICCSEIPVPSQELTHCTLSGLTEVDVAWISERE
ncbi:protein argonaute-3 [Drosophila tropicalis]|uniref:protein argonaute-3 n=1 Tax=Drosophila tropicalis TaxID=46794 RepID=UPI0035AB85EB